MIFKTFTNNAKFLMLSAALTVTTFPFAQEAEEVA